MTIIPRDQFLVHRQNLRQLIAALMTHPCATAAAREVESRKLWNRIADVACDEGVAGILLQQLSSSNIPIPDTASQQIERWKKHVIAANEYLFRRTAPVINALYAAGIEFVLLKGGALVDRLYHDNGARPMSDLDILVSETQIETVEKIFRCCGAKVGTDLVRDDFFPRHHYEREYLIGTPSVKIDLHVRPFRPVLFAKRMPVDSFLQNRSTIEFAGRLAFAPNAINMTIHLAVHAACHGAKHLRWLYDTYAWLERMESEIDVNEVARRANDWRLTVPLRAALHATEATFGPLKSSQAILHALPLKNDMLAELTLGQASRAIERPFVDVLMNAAGETTWRNRFAYLSAAIIPSEEHLGEIYPRRHAGWQSCAHAIRISRTVTRPFKKAAI